MRPWERGRKREGATNPVTTSSMVRWALNTEPTLWELTSPVAKKDAAQISQPQP